MPSFRLRVVFVLLGPLAACSGPITRSAPYCHRPAGTQYLADEQLPTASVSPEVSMQTDIDHADYFTLGSTMNHVAEVMGTPSRTADVGDEIWWYYRYSRVTFRNGKVAEWSNSGNNLKVILGTSAPAADYFTQGATTEQVIAVMGTPTRTATIGDEVWWYYGYSRITFKQGRVSSWSNSENNLKVQWSDSDAAFASSSDTGYSPTTLPARHYPKSSSGYSLPRLPSSSASRSYLHAPSFSDGYVDPHFRSGGYVRGYTRKDGTYVSPHYRSGGRVRGFSR
ncbi:MAG: outer membrane protein assembly factor BamE [Verrucomicrobiaceae bacterium]|nr:outer membrane protein assembly factor BamE [Verrucomicrobiaceae bacterium]